MPNNSNLALIVNLNNKNIHLFHKLNFLITKILIIIIIKNFNHKYARIKNQATVWILKNKVSNNNIYCKIIVEDRAVLVKVNIKLYWNNRVTIN